MSYEIERTSACRVVLSATIAAAEVTSEREHVLKAFLRQARIDGFRPGKAPRGVVERRFAAEIRDDVAGAPVPPHLGRRAARGQAQARPGRFEVKKAELARRRQLRARRRVRRLPRGRR